MPKQISLILAIFFTASVLSNCAGEQKGSVGINNHSHRDIYYQVLVRKNKETIKGPYSFHVDSITIPKLSAGQQIIENRQGQYKSGDELLVRIFAIDSTSTHDRIVIIREDLLGAEYIRDNFGLPWVEITK
jgi:hypothetical protein